MEDAKSIVSIVCSILSTLAVIVMVYFVVKIIMEAEKKLKGRNDGEEWKD